MGKKKKQGGYESGDSSGRHSSRSEDNSPKDLDNKDAEVFIAKAQELKNEGNKLFQKRDHKGAMLKYEKALQLLPRNHIDVSYLRSNMAACYMQMGLSEYPKAIHECNLALEVTPKYSKALLKRARCYEALNRLDLVLSDVSAVLKIEPNNVMAVEISERVKKILEKKGLKVTDTVIELPPDYVEPPIFLPPPRTVKEKMRRKKSRRFDERKVDNKVEEETVEETSEEKKADVKVVVEEKISSPKEEAPKKNVKLVFGEDIRWAQMPVNCTLLELREIVRDRFPRLRAVLIKYRDQEGDLVTITTNEELRWAEGSTESQGSMRLYIVGVDPEQDPFFEKLNNVDEVKKSTIHKSNVAENGKLVKKKQIKVSSCIEDWIFEFAQLFKKYVGLDADAYMDIHQLGIKLYSEAMEETVTSEEAQDLFDIAGGKFQEMASLALFNRGNVHVSRAKKRIYSLGNESKSVLSQIKTAYDWVKKEYVDAGKSYEEALEIKPDFYECFLALGWQQFEQARLSWFYAISSGVDYKTWPSAEVLQLYDKANDNIGKGMQMWEEWEKQHLNEVSRQKNIITELQKMGLDGRFKDMSLEEAKELAANMRTQTNLLWGTMLYERSMVEFKLQLPVWNERLLVSLEKFEVAGASPTDVAVMVKNHCSNDNALEGKICKCILYHSFFFQNLSPAS